MRERDSILTPNIVIIVIDAVRSYNLTVYGYHRNTTPFLCENKHEFAIYQNAISSTYWTMGQMVNTATGASAIMLSMTGKSLYVLFNTGSEFL
jgi:glucan phosphoethanolaminetransferase (alkaline phosphatase superfamily)